MVQFAGPGARPGGPSFPSTGEVVWDEPRARARDAEVRDGAPEDPLIEGEVLVREAGAAARCIAAELKVSVLFEDSARAAEQHDGEVELVVVAAMHTATEVNDRIVERRASALFFDAREGLRHHVRLLDIPVGDAREVVVVVAGVLEPVIAGACAGAG